MKVEMMSLDRLIPYENNPRLNDGAVDAVAQSVREFGWRAPIVTDENLVIICGHTRLKAAKKLGLKKVPVHVATGLTPAQVKAYRLADNKSAEFAEWDMELLPIELADLQTMDFDLDLVGFSDDELAELLEPDVQDGLTDPDNVPEPPDEAVTQPGDLWILGEHRLLCGDSGKTEDVDRLVDGAGIQLVNTDPPYNVNVNPRSSTAIAAGQSNYWDGSLTEEERKAGLLHHQQFDVDRGVTDPKKAKRKMRPKDRKLEGDFVTDEEFDEMLRAWFGQMARVLEPGRSFYIWGGYSNMKNYPARLKEAELRFAQAIIWDKGHPVLTRKDFLCCYEIVFYGWRVGAGHQFFGPNNVPDLWHLKKVPPQKMIHLTEKPVELAVRAMKYSSRAGENVLDLFGGSGSTLIGAEQTGRKAFLMELDPLYCDVIVQRYEEFSGQKAERVEG
ncbi:MAG: DNA methyltransferase [Planctomycetota bacterium]